MARSEFDISQEVEYIRRVQKGDSEAFGLLVEKYQQRIFSIVFHLVRRRDEVEDLAQEVFFKAFRAIRSYNFQSSFATWLSRIAVNHCYDYLRKVRASPQLLLGHDGRERPRVGTKGGESAATRFGSRGETGAEGFRWQAPRARAAR